MSMFPRKRHRVPGLNTASLPDLIFTVLFFFMIVTHMRSVPVKVRYQVPAGTELTKLTKKSTVTYIYIGKAGGGGGLSSSNEQGGIRIQLNDKYADVEDVIDYVTAERNSMSPEDAQAMTVSIKADRSTPMKMITEVKQALRKANALRINYSAVSRRSDTKTLAN